MKQRSCDKWLTIAALAGWFGSLGGMLALAVNTPSADRISAVQVKSKVAISRLKNDVKATVRGKAIAHKPAKTIRTEASLPSNEP